jgi:hypothetical protein
VFDRAVLSLCDGERDREAIVGELAGMVGRGEIGLKRDGRELAGDEVVVALREELGESLARLARSMVLLS